MLYNTVLHPTIDYSRYVCLRDNNNADYISGKTIESTSSTYYYMHRVSRNNQSCIYLPPIETFDKKSIFDWRGSKCLKGEVT